MAWGVRNSGSFTQVTPVTSWNSGSAIPLGFTPLTGSKLIVYVAVSSNFTATVKDNNGNTLTQMVGLGVATAGGVRGQIHAYDVPASVPTGIAITGAVGIAGSIVFQEVTGLRVGNTTAMLDGSGGSASAATQSVPSASYTSTALSEFLVSLYTDNGESIVTAAANSYTADTNIVNTSATGNVGVYYKDSTSGSEADGFTVSGGANTGECIGLKVAFKLAAPIGKLLAGRQAVPRAAYR